MQIQLILTFPVAAHFCVVCNDINFLQEFNSKFASYFLSHTHTHKSLKIICSGARVRRGGLREQKYFQIAVNFIKLIGRLGRVCILEYCLAIYVLNVL